MTNETALREALAAYDATVKACPANTQFLGEKPCPKCKAGSDEGCRKEILAAGDVITAVRSLLQSPSQPVVAEAEYFERVLNAAMEGAKVAEVCAFLATKYDGEGNAQIANGHSPTKHRIAKAYADHQCRIADAIVEIARPAHPQASPPPVQSEVTQADREAAADLEDWERDDSKRERFLSGEFDDTYAVQAFRAHRLAHSQTETQEGEAERRGEQRAIARIVGAARAIGWQAGVGGRETAGAIVSYLATSPDEIAPFVAGELSPIDFAGDWMRGGCLTWHAVNGKVVSPEDVAAALQEQEKQNG